MVSRRISLQYGVKSLERMLYGHESNNILSNSWHDYPNGRWGVGFDIGPIDRKWITLFATYEITSMQVSELKNRFGLGMEVPVFTWFDPVIRMVPGGGSFLSVYNWFDDRILMPLLYVQLYHYDAPAFSNRNPFDE